MDGKGCIDPPVYDAPVGYFEGGAKAGVAFEVADEAAAELGQVVFVGVLDTRSEEGE